jgi:nitroimidazol reductase NimA-like FMN-containing flavoprotein (pyridoxamine 5'-phosphate oxidase superfamily)
MRRKDREITEFQEILNILSRAQVCHVAFSGRVYPYVVPMNFGFEVVDGDQVILYFHSAMEGKKQDLLDVSGNVAFVVEIPAESVQSPNGKASQCTMAYESVMGEGKLTRLPPEEKPHGLEVLMAHYYEPGEIQLDFGENLLQHTSVLALKVEQMTGKRNQRL